MHLVRYGFVLVVLASAAGVAAQAPDSADVLARVNGAVITNADVEASLGQSLAKLQTQIYELKRAKLDALIQEQLIAAEARKRGVSPEALIEAEVTAKIQPVTEEEISAFYTANQARLQKDLAAWKDQIKAYLVGQRSALRRDAFAKGLREAGSVEVLLKAPPVVRAEVAVGDAHAKGAANAPVTIVEFSDFHCPFCRKVQPVLTQLVAKYGDRIRIAYKDFPLDNLHPEARAAAESARCAGEQGRFWEFHDKVYAGGSEASATTMRRYAQEAGVPDLDAFDACRASRKYQAHVQRDLDEGTRLGVTGTPAFFINGRFVSGALPVDAFSRVIDEELAAKR